MMASTHSAHCSSESHSNRYFLSASSRNASSRNTELLIITQYNYQNSNWLTTVQWTHGWIVLGVIKKGNQVKGNQDAAAHRQRSSDCPLSPPCTAPAARLQLAVQNTKNKYIKNIIWRQHDKFKSWPNWPPLHQSGNKTGSWRQVSLTSSSKLHDIKKKTKVKNRKRLKKTQACSL